MTNLTIPTEETTADTATPDTPDLFATPFRTAPDVEPEYDEPPADVADEPAAPPAEPPAPRAEDAPEPAIPEAPEHSADADTPPPAEAPVEPNALAAALPQEEDTVAEAAPADADGSKNAFWQAILTGDVRTVPSEVRKLAGGDEPELTDELRDYRLMSTINKSWAVDNLPLSREQVMSDWGTEREKLTKSYGVRNTEEELFLALSQRERDNPRLAAAENIYNVCYIAGLEGQDSYRYLAYTRGLTEADKANAEKLARAAYEAGLSKREESMAMAQRVARQMHTLVDAEKDVVPFMRMMLNMPELVGVIDDLGYMTPEDQNSVIYLALTLARKRYERYEPESVADRIVGALRRGAADVGNGLIQMGANLPIAIMNKTADLTDTPELQSLADEWDKRMQLVQKIRNTSLQELRPLVLPNEHDTIASYLVTAAETLPSLALASSGGAGFSVLTMGAVGNSVAEARVRAPETDQEMQLYAGVVAGAIQAGIYMNLNRLGGNLLERSMNRFARQYTSSGSYALGSLALARESIGEYGRLWVAGQLGELSNLALQERASYLSNTASNINWQDYGRKFVDIEANMHEAAALLPLLLMSSGRMGVQHLRSPQAVLTPESLDLIPRVGPAYRARLFPNGRPTGDPALWRELAADMDLPNNPEMLVKARRALQLLHTDQFRSFTDYQRVVDFMNLPQAPAIPGSVMSGLSLINPGFRPGSSARRRTNALALWNEWWEQGGMSAIMEKGDAPVGYTADMMITYDPQATDMSSPWLTGDYLSAYMPNGRLQLSRAIEHEVQHIHELSYRFLMHRYSVNSLINGGGTPEEWRSSAEQHRLALITAAAHAAMSSGMESADSTQSALASLESMLAEQPAHAADAPHAPEPALQATQPPAIMEALKSSISRLAQLLPKSDEFQSTLATGHSPQKAYADMLGRMLGIDSQRLFADYHQNTADAPENATPMQDYSALNAKRFEIYRNLTGIEMEQVVGEDGITYSRARRPNGSFTGWHLAPENAVNDVAGNADLAFMPHDKRWSLRARLNLIGRQFNMMNTPKARENEFSVYDELCTVALRDLAARWDGTATGLLPGASLVANRNYIRHLGQSAEQEAASPLISAVDASQLEFEVDDLSELTPLAMMQSRFYIYWQRMVRSGMVSTQEMSDFLVSQGFLTPDMGYALQNPELKPIYYWRPNIHSRDKARIERENGIINDTCSRMSEYLTLRFLATLDTRSVPPSLREWVSMAAFCPDVAPPAPEDSAQKRRLGRIDRNDDDHHRDITTWTNRRAAGKLREMAAQVDAVRRSIKPDEKMDAFVQEVFGENEAQNKERGWCHMMADTDGLLNPSPYYWNLLRSPEKAWGVLPRTEYRVLHPQLLAFCRQDPVFSSLGGEDPVPAAMAMLDDALRKYPELHSYSMRGSVSSTPKYMELIDPLTAQPVNSADDEAVARDYYVSDTDELPEFMRGEDGEQVAAALRLLDELRCALPGIPAAAPDGVRWKGELYGLNGKTPPGLDKDYEPHPALEPLVGLLQRITEQELAAGSVSVCGVRLHGLKPGMDLSPLLQGVTVYRHKSTPGKIYRLMPGDATLDSGAYRSPYLVHSRHGVYLGNRTAVKEMEDFQNEVIVPLASFRRQPERDYTKNGLAWAAMAWKLNFDEAIDLCEAVGNAPNPALYRARLQECIMRLAEDSGFAAMLGNADPACLTMGEARMLNVLSDMMTVACSNSPKSAQLRLKQFAAKARKAPDTIRPLMGAVLRASTPLPSWLDTPPAGASAAPRKARDKQQGLDVEVDIESEKLPVRRRKKNSPPQE